MARRGGKAASRRARQRKAPRRPVIPPPPTPVPPVGTPDAREAESLDAPTRTTPPIHAARGSVLTDRERAAYHYVERDLRNIGILTGVIALMLFVAWLAFGALGLVG